MLYASRCLKWCWLLLLGGSSVPVGVVALSLQEPSNNKLLILGLGRVGLECAKLALPQFDQVVGTVRNHHQNCEEEEDGIHRIPFDVACIRPYLLQASHVLITIPLPKERDDGLNSVVQEVRERMMSSTTTLSWMGILSTTGVYGNHDGAWVVEDDSELRCTPKSNAYLYRTWEDEWIAVSTSSHCPVAIFRCAGIYDSSRSALHTVYQKGVAFAASNNSADTSITNRIHSVDIANAVLLAASMQKQTLTKIKNSYSRIYNLGDNLPAPRSEVLAYAADLFQSAGIAIPAAPPLPKEPLSSPPLTTVRERRRQTDRKLVSNERMRQELLPELQYPTYKEGLQAILLDPTTPWQKRQ